MIIITNSDEGWVKYSAERYLPNLIPILENYRVISARTRYEKFYPNQPLCWKAAAFAHEVNEHFCQLEEARDMLDRECGLSGPKLGGQIGHTYDTMPDMDLVSTDDSSLGDNSISSAEAESPGAVGSDWVANKPAAVSPDSTDGNAIPNSSIAAPSYRREIISFGDSLEERTAVKIVSDQLDAMPKSVKFLRDPDPTQIIGQLTMLTHHMKFVCEHDQELDLEISQKQAEKCAKDHLRKRGLQNAGATGGSKGGPSILQRILGTPPSAAEDNMDHEFC